MEEPRWRMCYHLVGRGRAQLMGWQWLEHCEDAAGRRNKIRSVRGMSHPRLQNPGTPNLLTAASLQNAPLPRGRVLRILPRSPCGLRQLLAGWQDLQRSVSSTRHDSLDKDMN